MPSKNSDVLWARKLRKRGDLEASRRMLAGEGAAHDTYLRAYLVQTLGLARDPAAREELVPYLLDDPEGPVRGMAAQALGHIGSSWAVPQLIEALADGDKSVREAAALSLGTIGDPRAVGPLSTAVVSEEETMARAGAAVALGRIRDPAATGPLIAALKDNRLVVRRDAVGALAQAGRGEAARQALREAGRSIRNVVILPKIRHAIRKLS